MRSFIAISVFLFATASHAASLNIDFDDATYVSGAIQVPQEFVFTSNTFFAGTTQVNGFGSNFCPVTPGPPSVGNFYCAIAAAVNRVEVDFMRIDGSAFDLVTLDAYLVSTTCQGYGTCRGDDATISAWNSSNQLIATKTISYSTLGSTWSTISFDGAWTGISRVTFAGQRELGSEAGSYAYLDNINVSVVPIPPAVWLFGSALAGLGWLRRKHTV